MPRRLEAFTANCLGGGECIEDPELIERTGEVCGVDVAVQPREDVAIMITFADDGSCEVALMPGSDGSEFNQTSEPSP